MLGQSQHPKIIQLKATMELALIIMKRVYLIASLSSIMILFSQMIIDPEVSAKI
jgi:hypothetical protein